MFTPPSKDMLLRNSQRSSHDNFYYKLKSKTKPIYCLIRNRPPINSKLRTIQLPRPAATLTRLKAPMKHHIPPIRININPPGGKDALIIRRPQQNPAVRIHTINRGGEGIFDIIVIAGIAMGAIE